MIVIHPSDQEIKRIVPKTRLSTSARGSPLRTIRRLVNETLALMELDFAALYAGIGRPSIAPEKLLRAMLLQAFYSVRSER